MIQLSLFGNFCYRFLEDLYQVYFEAALMLQVNGDHWKVVKEPLLTIRNKFWKDWNICTTRKSYTGISKVKCSSLLFYFADVWKFSSHQLLLTLIWIWKTIFYRGQCPRQHLQWGAENIGLRYLEAVGWVPIRRYICWYSPIHGTWSNRQRAKRIWSTCVSECVKK